MVLSATVYGEAFTRIGELTVANDFLKKKV